MKSMTGYGRGECSQDGFKVTVELSSVNRKQTEIAVYLPRELESLESRVRDEVNRRIARGRISVKVSWHLGENATARQVHVNIPLAKAYAQAFAKLSRELKLAEDVPLNLIVQAPGVLEPPEELSDAETIWPILEKSLDQGLHALVTMREREGAHLSKDLRRRMTIMGQCLKRIKKTAPAMVKKFQDQLRERIKNAGLELPQIDDERLVKEVVYFADRSDISEELTRLESHLAQFDHCIQSKEPIGRTLDFLAQEMNREINTIGSKAADVLISREVVTLKAELEKFREQVQNVE